MAQTPEIKVRFAPDGVEAVGAAFRKIEREGAQAGRVSAAALGGLNGAVKELVSLLPAISLAVIGREIVTRTIDAERAFNRLNTVLKTTGFAAGLTVKELNEIAESLKQSTPFDDDEIRKGISALLRFRDVQGDVFRQAIKLTADLATATDKDFESAAQLIGRALTNPESLRGLREAGINLSENQIELAKNMKATGDIAGAQRIVIEALTKSIGGAAAGENVGLYGATRNLSKAWDDLLKAIGKMQTFRGETFINAITRDLQTLAKVISESKILDSLLAFATLGLVTPGPERKEGDAEIEEIDKQIQFVRKQLVAGTANPPGASSKLFSFLVPDIKLGQAAVEELKKTLDRLEIERARLVRIQNERLPPTSATPGADPDADRAREGEAARRREQSAELEAVRARARAEHQSAVSKAAAEHDLQQERDFTAQRLRVLDQYYAQGLISLEDYHSRRRTIIQIGLDAELEAINAKLIEEHKAHDKALREGDLQKSSAVLVAMGKLLNEGHRLRSRAAAEQVLSILQEREQREALGREQLQLDVKLLEAQGKRKEAALKALEAEIEATEKLLRLRGQTPEQISARTGALRDTQTRNIEFDEQGRQASQALRDLDLERERINNQVARGLIFQFEGEERIIAAEQRRLVSLREIATKMRDAAISQEQIQQADEFAAAVERIAVNIDKAGREMAEFKQRAFEAVSSSLSDFLTNGIRDAKNFGEAIKGLAFSISQSMAKIQADILAKKITEKAFSLLGIATEGPEKVTTAAAAGTAQATPLTAAATALSAAGTTVISGATAISLAAGELLAAATAMSAAAASAGAAGAAQAAGGASGLFSGFFASAAAGGAEGGLITGPGTGTSDSIPARLSTGEFVMRAAAVKRIGAEALHAMNAGMRPFSIAPIHRGVAHFAEGGLVGGGRSGFDATMTIKAAPGTEVVDFHSNSGALITTIQRNKRAIRAALGV